MKLKTLIAVLLGGFLLQQQGICQTDAVATNDATVAADTNEAAASAPATNEAVVAADTNEAAASAPATNEAVVAADTNEAAASAPATNEAVVAADTNEAAASAPATNEAVVAADTNEAAASAPATNEAVVAADTNEAAASTPATTNLPVMSAADSNATVSIAGSNTITATTASNMPAAIVDTNAPVTAVASGDQSTNVTAPESAAISTIPLIQFQDVPITTAIENLARQAGINYLLDPKIGYGQPDQNGQVKAEPTLSIRWENITAEHALMALLDNYGLQLVEDPKTEIARITIKDPSAPPPLFTRVIQLKYASVSNMVAAVSSTLSDKRSRVVSDARTSQLVVVGTEGSRTMWTRL